ncbi:MAG: molecular chaperone Hsp90 [Eubacterium sp.]|nr:molecular chaperone Hsp90 [Eubacterium sp.]
MTKTEMANEILNAESACKELKEAAQKFIDSIGTADEAARAEELVKECEEDVSRCEDVCAFMKTEDAKKVFGAEVAANIYAHEHELLEKGVEFCDCSGCTAGKRVLENKELFLK